MRGGADASAARSSQLICGSKHSDYIRFLPESSASGRLDGVTGAMQVRASSRTKTCGGAPRTLSSDITNMYGVCSMYPACRRAGARVRVEYQPGSRRVYNTYATSTQQQLAAEIGFYQSEIAMPCARAAAHAPGCSISWPEGKRNARNGHSVCSGDQMRDMGGGRERGNQRLAAASPSRRRVT